MSAFSILGERIVKLNAVAEQGNIEDFYGLIQEDVKLLEDVDELPFVDTPLHIAASAGGPQHIQKFAMEMMRLKPSFARKPNVNGYSPIHLALQAGHTQMVRRLLQVDGDLVRVKGKEGRTPLHDVAAATPLRDVAAATPLRDVAAAAATEQRLDLLFKFLSDCPNSIEDVTIQNQTALHISLLNNNLDAFKRLVRWLRKNKSENARDILNGQDEEGNTVLHVAVSKNQTEAVRELLYFGVNLNARNLEGHTAQDMLQEQRQVNNSEIRDMLSYAGALSCSCSFLPKVNCYEYCIRKPKVVLFFERLQLLIKTAREGSRISNDERNALLVVAALFITITYQVVLSPPGGLETGGTAVAQATFESFGTVATINYITFTLSAIVIFLLLPSGYISALFKMTLVQLWVSYYFSLAVICDSERVLYYCLISTGLCFVLVLIAFFGRQFCGARIKWLQLHWIFYIVYACILFFVSLVEW